MRLQSVTTMSCSRLSWLQFPTPLQSPGQVLLPRGAGFHATGCAHGVRDGGRVWGKRGGYSGHPRQPKCPCAHASHATPCLCSPCSAMRPCSASGGQSSHRLSEQLPRLILRAPSLSTVSRASGAGTCVRPHLLPVEVHAPQPLGRGAPQVGRCFLGEDVRLAPRAGGSSSREAVVRTLAELSRRCCQQTELRGGNACRISTADR